MLNWILRKIFRITNGSIYALPEQNNNNNRNGNNRNDTATTTTTITTTNDNEPINRADVYITENEPRYYCRFCNGHSHNIFNCNSPLVNDVLNEYIFNAFRLKYDRNLLYIYLFQKQRVVLQMIAIHNRINISHKTHGELAEEVMKKFILMSMSNRRYINGYGNSTNLPFEILRRHHTQLFNMMRFEIGLQPNGETNQYEDENEMENEETYAIQQHNNEQNVTHRRIKRRMRIVRRFSNGLSVSNEITENTNETENNTINRQHPITSFPLKLNDTTKFTPLNKCNGECPICFENNNDSEKKMTFVTTNCNHSFCVNCVKQLIYQKISSNTTQHMFEPKKLTLQCPMCRTKINSLYAESVTDTYTFEQLSVLLRKNHVITEMRKCYSSGDING